MGQSSSKKNHTLPEDGSSVFSGAKKKPDCFTRIKECLPKGSSSSAGRKGGHVSQDELGALRNKYAAAQQEHVFRCVPMLLCVLFMCRCREHRLIVLENATGVLFGRHFDSLSKQEQSSLVNQLRNIDPQAVLERYARTTATSKDEMTGGIEACTPTRLDLSSSEDRQNWNSTALKAIGNGEVGVILLAGGQGTRLGFSQPKGCFPGDNQELLDAWLPSGKTLFCLQAQRILRLQALAAAETGATNAIIQWYIMTSPQTHNATEKNLLENQFYGLAPTQVHLFQQGTLPCIANDGTKFIMNSPSEVATAPDGNGGIYAALHNSGMIADMEHKNVKYLFTNAIDNCVCKIADPLFLGFCINGGFKAGNKVTEKRTADEKVGIQGKRNGCYEVVEYSDIDEKVRDERDEHGKLVFSSGSVCIHYYSLDFLRNECHPQNLSKALHYHIARKKIPYWDEETETKVTPTEINGVKLETFIFDVFKLAGESFGVFEVQREEEFAPIKNKSIADDGSLNNDSPIASLKQVRQDTAVGDNCGAIFVFMSTVLTCVMYPR